MRKGLLAAGAMNIGGVLVFSRVFTDSAIRWIVGSFTIEELAYVVVWSR